MLTNYRVIPIKLLKIAPLIVPLIIGIAIKDPLASLYSTMANPAPIMAIAPSSDQLAALADQAYALNQHGKTKEAIDLSHSALRSSPSVARILLQTGSSYASQNNHDMAVHYYTCALTLEPRYISGYIALSISLMQLKQYQKAIEYCSMALKLMPDNLDAHLQLSKAYMDLGDYAKALSHAQAAYDLQPTNVHTLLNLGHIHNKQGTLDEACTWYKKAIALNLNFANAHYNLGYTLRIMKKPHEALTHLLKAEQLKPGYVDAHIALAQTYWGLKEYDRAWKEYEWRWKLLGVDPHAMETPLWDGCDLQGKTILLYCEQGLGDTLQFIRYAKMVKQKGGIVIAKIQKPLVDLLKSYPHVDRFITSMDDVKGTKIDYQTPLLNLPGIFKTNEQTIPAEIPYLKADAKLVKFWQQKLASDKKYKIGLCWHVDPEHELDKSPWSKRNIEAKQFVPLAQISGVSFYSLQKVNGEDQLKQVPENFTVHTFGYNFDEKHGRFMDTAAVIANLDLIITVDTSIAHVAGAMGKNVWMLLPYSPDPRWYDEGNNSKWYPTMKLFRQPKPYDWHSVIENIKSDLKKEAQHMLGNT